MIFLVNYKWQTFTIGNLILQKWHKIVGGIEMKSAIPFQFRSIPSCNSNSTACNSNSKPNSGILELLSIPIPILELTPTLLLNIIIAIHRLEACVSKGISYVLTLITHLTWGTFQILLVKKTQ